MTSAFVTGGTGFLGRHLAEQLTAAGWETTCLHRRASDTAALQALGVHLAEGDLLDRDAVTNAVPPGVDTVFHVAGNTSTWARHASAQLRDNIEGTASVLAAAQAAGVRRFVHVSTWNVYDLSSGEINESSPKTGASAKDTYTRSKTVAEELAFDADRLEVVVVNPSHILGRYDSGNWARMVTMVDRGKIPGIPPGAGSFCWAPEVARTLIAAAERGRPGTNYLLGGTDASFLAVFRGIGALLHKPVPKRTVPKAAIQLAARIQTALASVTGKEPDLTPAGARMVTQHPRIRSTRAADELGYRTMPLDVMLRDVVDWMRNEGLLT